MRDYKIILNLFDDGADSNGGESTNDANQTTVDPKVAARGRSLGLPDDMLADYDKAFGGKAAAKGEQETESNESNENNQEDEETGAQDAESLESRFDELIKGEFKDVYKNRVASFVKDRNKSSKRENAELRGKLESAAKLGSLLSSKYENVAPDDFEALIEAVRNDDDTWRQRSIETGESVEQLIEDYDSGQQRKAEHEELEMFRRQEAVRQLDMRLQSQAKKTQEQYPDFDLESEFENPRFCSALDYIAAQNAEKNKRTGKSDEIYDVTFAYEMAHADELKANTIKKTAKATAGAVAQTIAANRNRARENAGSVSASPKTKSISEMSDEEFARLVDNVRSGKAKIPT